LKRKQKNKKTGNVNSHLRKEPFNGVSSDLKQN